MTLRAGSGMSWLCYYRALQLGPVSNVAPIDELSVTFAIVLGIYRGRGRTFHLAGSTEPCAHRSGGRSLFTCSDRKSPFRVFLLII